ncbi:Hypothetical protein PP7435_CHR3-0963 [Komagataella phaffii CBS 7435]|uniref:BED-type domain-containing protein n=2 Tax=Komagataella phaffii TaxID=460519 RepID=C4R411_KOMPG|nr:Hypothetical protein PAS_chr3_0260 [Komagataella phaffii GS115]AOA63359.1 GQ67_03311T0 [Komagataella phaffii]CAH2449959.1 Hypothetical protein BQ9382_C3-5060 [Komagataella phaffii CBS 7435]AOA68352.1 GQ68_03280T0 [Komagataella phaffii GS115]CAY70297.1 Hypothetical protein PAS_chr3_0260 [Komagataella phaffii GS115]CCA39909.1 Hypothetical protein PP7435_CHR3-0963 [Komagataella phaffii CBS 7435]
MSLPPLINGFDRQTSESVESTLAQALNQYEPSVQLHNTGNAGSKNRQQQQQQPQFVVDKSKQPVMPGASVGGTPSSLSHHNQLVHVNVGDSGPGRSGSNVDDTVSSSPGHGSSTNAGGVVMSRASMHDESQHPRPATTSNITRVRHNRPGMKFGAKKKSWVWDWFVQDSTDPNVAICDQCGRIIRRLPSDKGSPKKLSEHLRTHKIDKDTVIPNRDALMNNYAANGITTQLNGSNSLTQLTSSSNNGSGYPNVSNSMVSNNQVNNNNNGPRPNVVPVGGLAHVPQHLLSEFDISPYSQMKFHKDIMRFLTEQKLSIDVVKTHAFRQIIFTLRPDAIVDLNDLDHIYSSFMEVLKNNAAAENKKDSRVDGPEHSWL